MPDVVPLADLEKAGIRLAMETYGARGKRQAAGALGISLKSLYDRLHRFGMTEYISSGGSPRGIRP